MIYCDFQVSRRSAQLMEESKEFQLIIDITEKKLDENSRRKYLRWSASPAQYRYSMEEFQIFNSALGNPHKCQPVNAFVIRKLGLSGHSD